MQFGTVLRMIAELAELKGEDKQKYLDIYESQKKLVNEKAWDGKWYIRCITDDGRYIGSEKEPQAKIWLNSQSWSVISGMGENGQTAMDSVNEYLDTDLGIKKIHPSMKDYPSKEDPLTYYNKGCGENGSESDKFGLANVSWLTGTAAWMYIAVTQYMLGIRAKWDGLEIDPCLPKELLPAKVTRVFRGKKYNITITKNEKIFIKDDDKNVNVVI